MASFEAEIFGDNNVTVTTFHVLTVNVGLQSAVTPEHRPGTPPRRGYPVTTSNRPGRTKPVQLASFAKVKFRAEVHVETQRVIQGGGQLVVDNDPLAAPAVASIVHSDCVRMIHALAASQGNVFRSHYRRAKIRQGFTVKRLVQHP